MVFCWCINKPSGIVAGSAFRITTVLLCCWLFFDVAGSTVGPRTLVMVLSFSIETLVVVFIITTCRKGYSVVTLFIPSVFISLTEAAVSAVCYSCRCFCLDVFLRAVFDRAA